jgi:hypothetical protein
LGKICAVIASVPKPFVRNAVILDEFIPMSVILRYFGASIGRPVIDNYDFDILEGLMYERV